MTEWLIRHFVKDRDNVASSAVRMRYGQFAGIVGIVCNIVLCLMKGAIGLIAGSVSIVADAVNNLSDASSNVVSLLGFKLASRPPDPKHPYGHGRYEYLSALVVAAVIVAVGLELVTTSVDKVVNPTPVEFSWVLVGVLLLSMAVKLWMMVFNNKVGKTINSDVLRATAIDSRNDVIATGAVLLSALVSHFAGIQLDGFMGMAVGAFIIWGGIGLIRETVNPLLGEAPDDAMVEHIREKILSYPGVLGTHDLMVHDYGPGRQFASAHVEMAAEANPLASHDVLDDIEQDFLADDNLIMTLHYDPIVTSDEAVGSIRSWISEAVKEIDPRITIHDLRTIPGVSYTTVIFDCVRPADLPLSPDELRSRIEELVHAEYPTHVCKIIVDESYVSSKQ